MIGLAIATTSDASATTAERTHFLAKIAEADLATSEDILVYSDIALDGLDSVSVYFGGVTFLQECIARAQARIDVLRREVQ